MEINNKDYKRIVKLSDKGDKYVEKGKFKSALDNYYKALDLVPDPKSEYDASTWLYVAIGDAYFLAEDYKETYKYMKIAINIEDNIGNPFILLRLGQSLFELEDFDKAKEYLLQAYMLEGEEIFENDEEYYLDFIKKIKDDDFTIQQNEEIIVINEGMSLSDEIDTKINELFDESEKYFKQKKYDEVIKILYNMWDLLPEPKEEYEESYYIVSSILLFARYLDNHKILSEWKEKILIVDLNRIDDGDREKKYGIAEYILGNKDRSLEYFRISEDKLGEILFDDDEKEFKEFYTNFKN